MGRPLAVPEAQSQVSCSLVLTLRMSGLWSPRVTPNAGSSRVERYVRETGQRQTWASWAGAGGRGPIKELGHCLKSAEMGVTHGRPLPEHWARSREPRVRKRPRRVTHVPLGTTELTPGLASSQASSCHQASC